MSRASYALDPVCKSEIAQSVRIACYYQWARSTVWTASCSKMFPRGESRGSAQSGAAASGRPFARPRTVRRVVVADDDQEMGRGLKLLLELWGFEVAVAQDGMAALAAIRAVRPHVALLDITLPRLNGLEVARQLRQEDRSEMLLVALTGYGGEEHRRVSAIAGFDEHLVKPVEPDVLRTLLLRIRPSSSD
jgi:CheY-like chemotaxis protein